MDNKTLIASVIVVVVAIILLGVGIWYYRNKKATSVEIVPVAEVPVQTEEGEEDAAVVAVEEEAEEQVSNANGSATIAKGSIVEYKMSTGTRGYKFIQEKSGADEMSMVGIVCQLNRATTARSASSQTARVFFTDIYAGDRQFKRKNYAQDVQDKVFGTCDAGGYIDTSAIPVTLLTLSTADRVSWTKDLY